jgi:antitoxin HicB
MRIFNYTVIFEPLPEGGFNVVFPAIPEICTSGATIEEARAMAEDALRCYIEDAIKARETLPIDKVPAIERIAVSV